ncbi:MAG: CopG family transcriptional regulator [Acidobacteria bacterium]|nr:CopG family transcriptional regulator [Acidobacteriota bacterium]MBI3470909.1 CopG family transcriptional regulator [Candidatus Solibacter usitatus]
MSQITIYLDEETAALMKAAVRGSGLSQSKWVALAVRERVRSEWPCSVSKLAGAWPDFPSAEELRTKMGTDATREPL